MAEEEPVLITEPSSPKTLDPIHAHGSTTESHQSPPQDALSNQPNDDVAPTEKRKRDDGDGDGDGERKVHPLWKTSLCSYFRSHNGSCSHGTTCRFAHSEEELRLRPDNTWDPTSERAKKAQKTDTGEKRDVADRVMMTEAVDDDDEDGGDDALRKCLVHLPRKWSSENFRKFLNDEVKPVLEFLISQHCSYSRIVKRLI